MFLISLFIFVSLLIPLSIISEYIFLEPYVVGHIPNGSEIGFILIVIVSALSGLVLPMNIFRIKTFKTNSKRKMTGGVVGSFFGAAAGACSCGPIGFAVISTFGAAGGVATSFLTNYEIPIIGPGRLPTNLRHGPQAVGITKPGSAHASL